MNGSEFVSTPANVTGANPTGAGIGAGPGAAGASPTGAGMAGIDAAVLAGINPSSRARAVASQQDGVIAAWQCQRLGVSPNEIKRLCRSGHWRRLYRGVYFVDADIVGEPSPRGVTRAGLLSAGPAAVAVLGTAAAIHGIAGLPRADGQVHVSLPGEKARPRRLADRGLALHQLRIDSTQLTVVDGVPVTTPLRTVADLILRLDRYTAICVMDSALNQGLVTEQEFAALPELIAGRRGVERARLWIPETDARAASPLETRVRLRCVDSRVAPDTLQHPVYGPGGELLGIGDLAWLRARLLGEADGVSIHDQPDAVFRDRWRQNDLHNAGWTIIRFTWEDTFRDGYIGYIVRQALARAVAP